MNKLLFSLTALTSGLFTSSASAIDSNELLPQIQTIDCTKCVKVLKANKEFFAVTLDTNGKLFKVQPIELPANATYLNTDKSSQEGNAENDNIDVDVTAFSFQSNNTVFAVTTTLVSASGTLVDSKTKLLSTQN